jgi:hypothetical protein
MKNLLNSAAEEPRDSNGQRKRWAVSIRLDRVDRLSRHPELSPEIGLGQTLTGTQ